METYRILAINPGSTSTKIAVFDNEREVFTVTLRHTAEELAPYAHVTDQFEFRYGLIVEALRENGIDLHSLNAVIGRGGLVRPIPSGVYPVNDRLEHDLKNSPLGEHASNLGGLLARYIAAQIPGAQAFIADPVVVDELQDVARVAGHPLFKRVSIFHALNQKAIARAYAEQVGKAYESMNLVIAHLGGGVSVGAHRQGEVVDVNNALDGDGPFSPERSGSLPTGQLVSLCFDGKYSEEEIRHMLCGKGGLVAYLDTNDTRVALSRVAKGDKQAALVMEAMCYTVGKWIGAMAAVLEGRVDAIIITGGIANNEWVCDRIRRMSQWIAPVVVVPGENEMEALALNALRVLRGEVAPKEY